MSILKMELNGWGISMFLKLLSLLFLTLTHLTSRLFIEKTGQLRNVTQGDLWDLSADLFQETRKKRGKDPVKEATTKLTNVRLVVKNILTINKWRFLLTAVN